MSVQAKVDAVRAQSQTEEKRDNRGKYRRLTIVERCGKFTICWVILWAVLAGGSWVYVCDHAGMLFEVRTVVITPVRADFEETGEKQGSKLTQDADLRVEAISDTIYSRESSRGLNNYSKCSAAGKVNGIGYGITGDGSYMCFDSHADEMDTLGKWIVKHFNEGMSEQELMCHYSGNNYAGC